MVSPLFIGGNDFIYSSKNINNISDKPKLSTLISNTKKILIKKELKIGKKENKKIILIIYYHLILIIIILSIILIYMIYKHNKIYKCNNYSSEISNESINDLNSLY